MKLKQTLLIGIATLAVGSAATTARAGGFSLSIHVGVPRPAVHIIHRPPVVLLPRVVLPAPRVVLPLPRVVVGAPPWGVHGPYAMPAPRVVVVAPGHLNRHAHRVHHGPPQIRHPKHFKQYHPHHRHDSHGLRAGWLGVTRHQR